MMFTILQKVAYSGLLLLAVIVLNFFLLHAAPGDVADTIAQSMGGADAETMERIRADYGLDLPLWQQLLEYVTGVLHGDLGYSFFFNVPVTELLLERLPATLLLVITAQLLALTVGVLLGVISARRPNGLASHFVTLLALFGYSAPVFWTGIMLLIVFSLMVPIFPVAGMSDATLTGGWWAHAVDVAHHLVLPAITLASIFLALYSRLCRASMLEVLGSDYIRTAKAKGLSEGQVVVKHALKNALSPVVTLAGLQFSAVVSGAVLVETVFSWPGLGTLALQSIIARDTPTILGILFFSSLVVVVVNLITDMVLRLIDPRIRTGVA
ncbi:ABC transporter permease [uncultured Paracoccus sp.]|uniref:ABC transporter permease n=1 Tax=uncultured Paracoccus sp. TaxID=189685 RepID=UPI002617E388|nr:ABC transporter permease [uncultured Paracoccus sp.]